MGAKGTFAPGQRLTAALALALAILAVLPWVSSAPLAAADTVNQENRRLTPPTVTVETVYTNSAADAIMANTQFFPTNNPWNEDISGAAVAANSPTLISANGSGVSIGCNNDMPFVIVPPADPLIAITYGAYGSESDPGPYRLPLTAPIEGGSGSTGDRHTFSIDPINGVLYELYRAFPQSSSWLCDCSCKWNLKSNATRTAGWTSCDAAGLSVFAGVVRYDECQRGMVEHAIRVTFTRTRNSYVYPATHQAGSAGTDRIRMGERFRLKASVDISTFPKHAKAIALAMKKYGVICADNGSNWLISNVPDSRFSGLNALAALHGSDFEVIVTTGATGGPRAPGAGNTHVHAGYAQTITLPAGAQLDGAATDPDTTTLTYAWTQVSGPGGGTATFSNAAILNPTASFNAAGSYVLQLSAREGTNPAATATVTISVNAGSGNQAPLIQSPAAATPNPVVNQTTTAVSVTATDPDSGPAALTYTWSKTAGPGTVTFSPNATTASANSTATFSASGTYSLLVTVSDSAATATSSIPSLVVTLPTAPSITTPPANQSVTVGQTASFSVAASGTPTLTYQWQKNGGPITGATGSSYTTPATVIGDNGATFRVVVTNSYGNATSTAATLTVTTTANPVTVTVPSVNLTAPPGSTTPVSVTITLTNTTGSAITVTPSLTGGGGWLSTSGAVVVPANSTATLTVTGDPTGQSGTLSATLTLTNSPGGQTRTIPVTLSLVASGSGGGGKSGCALSSEFFPAGASSPIALLPWLALTLALTMLRQARSPKPEGAP